MRVERKVSNTTTIEATGATVAEVFEQLAQLESVFCGHERCGLCSERRVSYQCQQDASGNKYYKAVCLDCGGKFRFGVRKQPQGMLFPQLKDKLGAIKPNAGWTKWTPNTNNDY